MFIKIHNLVWN